MLPGDFIVDDDGQGYMDIGEEDDHWNARGDRSGLVMDALFMDAGAPSASLRRHCCSQTFSYG
jgi:hypothetical protein